MSATPQDALARLVEGNRRFAAGAPDPLVRQRVAGLTELAGGQAPIAAVLGCADSRVPPEVVFDTGPGELFVVRVAGHVAEPSARASLEFAVRELGCRLAVVLGHSGCGAVDAAVAAADGYDALVDPIREAIGDATGNAAVRTNVHAVVAGLRGTLEPAEVVGAIYSLGDGTVDWLEPRAGGRG